MGRRLYGGVGKFKDTTVSLPMRPRLPFLLELSAPAKGLLLGFHAHHLFRCAREMNSERKVKYMSDQLSILSEAPIWREKVVTGWRRFSSGLWRVPEGDIQSAYCADTFPKVKIFTHDGHPFANYGGHFSGPIAAGADCYPLIL